MIPSPDQFRNRANPLGRLENSVSIEFTSPQFRSMRKADEAMEDSIEQKSNNLYVMDLLKSSNNPYIKVIEAE
jgi:hypothetical protein